jgi:hypothetical protein
MQVQGDWRDGILMQARFESPGKSIVKPSLVTFRFSSATNTRVYADNREVTISLDGKQVFSTGPVMKVAIPTGRFT